MRFECIIGPMFGGKSTELCRRMHRLESIGRNVLYVRPSKDTRDEAGTLAPRGCTFSHIGSRGCVTLPTLCDTLSLLQGAVTYDAVAVDETQFFDDAAAFVHLLEHSPCAQTENIIVIFSYLSGDSDRKPWASVQSLLPLMDDVMFLKACCVRCADGTEAAFTKCLVPKTNIELIGDAETYISVCRKHYLVE